MLHSMERDFDKPVHKMAALALHSCCSVDQHSDNVFSPLHSTTVLLIIRLSCKLPTCSLRA